MRILVAEDEPINRRLLTTKLSKWGHEVVTCEDGAEAWDLLQKEDAPELVILDWMMPGMSGPDICRALRKLMRQPYTYVILLTAKNRPEDIVGGLDAGADDYIIKPFDPHELRVRIRAGVRILQLQHELIEALKVSEHRASHDPLTGLWNRAAILEILRTELTRRERELTPVRAIIADVDHFKEVNDTLGHQAGDAVLKETANRLERSLRPYDSVGRYGGEEFLIVLPGKNGDNGRNIAERLRLLFDGKPMQTDAGEVAITMSLGVVETADHKSWNVDEVIAAADRALYQAKNNGRNRVEVWTPRE